MQRVQHHHNRVGNNGNTTNTNNTNTNNNNNDNEGSRRRRHHRNAQHHSSNSSGGGRRGHRKHRYQEEGSSSSDNTNGYHRSAFSSVVTKRVVVDDGDTASGASADEQCLVCAEPITIHNIYQNCDHRGICGKCSLTQRQLMKDTHCCICKTDSPAVVLTEHGDRSRSYNDFNLSMLPHDSVFNVYTTSQRILDKVIQLRELKCPVCTALFNSMHKLENHLSSAHRLFYCRLCLDNRKMFLQDQKLYTWPQLKSHFRHGERDEHGLITGHPMCKFCMRRHYSDEDLFAHMHIEHMECHICQQNGIRFAYFKDYDDLEVHFDTAHFLCHDRVCLENKFIVFSSEIDLRAHQIKYHGGRGQLRRDLARLTIGDGGGGGSSSSSNSGNSSRSSYVQDRRQIRMGQIDSSVINFIGAPSDVHEEFEESSSRGQGRRGKKKAQQQQQQQPRREPSSSSSSRATEEPAGPVYTPSSTQSDIKTRQSNLMKAMRSLLSKDELERFKQTSLAFQKGAMFAVEYYRIFWKMFGDESAAKLFPDLVETLPDEKKREALILAHQTAQSGEFGDLITSSPSSPSSSSSSSSLSSSSSSSSRLQSTQRKNRASAASAASSSYASAADNKSQGKPPPINRTLLKQLRTSAGKQQRPDEGDFPSLASGHQASPTPQQPQWQTSSDIPSWFNVGGSRQKKQSKRKSKSQQ